MTARTHVFAGDCIVEERGTADATHRGRVVVIVKPDDTVLVHDASGYQPVAWLTRADAVAVETRPSENALPGGGRETLPPAEAATGGTGDGESGFVVTAQSDGRTLRIAAVRESGAGRYPTSAAGTPVAACPGCDGPLVRVSNELRCLDCDGEYVLPSGATLLDERCDCGLPRIRVARGDRFELCANRECDSLDAAIRDRFDGEWDCPKCGAVLRVLRRGGLIAGCDRYPDCETGFAIPNGVVVADCACGLPVFENDNGRRCLDANCTAFAG